jgi:hypothetical protein
MGFLSNTKQRISKEIADIKYNRQLENDPAVVRSRLDVERANVRKERDNLLSKRQLEQDKKELQQLRNSTGIRGKISSGLSAVRSHLDNVRSRNEGSKGRKIRAINPLKQGLSDERIGPARNNGAFDIKGSGSQITSGPNPKGMNDKSSSIVGSKKKSKGVFG